MLAGQVWVVPRNGWTLPASFGHYWLFLGYEADYASAPGLG
jgi:hypothetical protein